MISAVFFPQVCFKTWYLSICLKSVSWTLSLSILGVRPLSKKLKYFGFKLDLIKILLLKNKVNDTKQCSNSEIQTRNAIFSFAVFYGDIKEIKCEMKR